jgi:spermidine synthase
MNFIFRNRLLIYIILWGVSLSITQTVLFREYLCVAEGNEISVGLMLSLWLLFNSMGALLWAFRKGVVSSKLYLFPIIGFLLSIFAIVFLRYVNVILSIPQGTTADLKTIFFIGLLSVSLPAIISGSSFPFLCAQPDLSERKESIALVYGCESLGLVIGYLLTIIAISIKVSHFSLLSFLYGLSLIYLLILKKEGIYIIKKLLTAVVVLFTVLFTLHYLDRFTLQNSFLYRNKGYEFIDYIDTNYNRNVLAKRSEQYALFVNNRFSRLIGDDYNSKLISHLTMSILENTKDVLVVGEASFDMLKHIGEHRAVRIDYIEYDSNLRKFLQKNISINRIDGVNTIFDDGRRFIRETEKKYDVVILDISDPINLQLNRFYSVEFFGEVKRILNERGILLLSLPSISSVPSDTKREFLISVFNALKNQFMIVKPVEYDRTYLLSSQIDFDLEFDNLI